METTEKRLDNRVDVTFACVCEEDRDVVGYMGEAVVLDLSFGGVLLQSEDVLPVGTKIVLTPISPDRELLVPLTAEVVRVHSSPRAGRAVQLGTRFDPLGPAQRRCLVWLMNNSPQTLNKVPPTLGERDRSSVSTYRMRMRLWLQDGKRTSARRAA
ncbi:MAG: PilZ domain-containing protein [Myxococcales bacterium FL481]|nr:MAG: PilZ domain-containing protein [Myxococcales bacterium FL481]